MRKKERKEEIFFMDLTYEDTEENKQLIDQVKSIENYRVSLYQEIEHRLQYRQFMPLEEVEELEDVLYGKFQANYDGKNIILRIDDIFPTVYIKTVNKSVAYMTGLWETGIVRAIRKLSIYPIQYEKIRVWVNIHYTRKYWDIDNRYVKPIIDGIVMSGIVKGDNFTEVEYGVSGHQNHEYPFTKVIITPLKNDEENSNKICKKQDEKFW